MFDPLLARPRWFELAVTALLAAGPAAQIPHNQDRAPNAPRTALASLERMTVPPGFAVELVAAEPDLVNPVAMCFDDRGRIWIAESLEYPRITPGPGRDRIKIFADRDGDGRAETVTVFADGLNIPSGLAVDGDGAWVVNAPDLLRLRDTDGDGRADTREVVLTGLGREDAHELPNSLTFGPDGWLYGLNGVFNESVVRHQGRVHRFTCAMFRIHPRTLAFEVFAEGTSNPWGIAFDGEGAAFVSACVIDHLWHLVESGNYVRQAGAHPPHAWPIGSIVTHRHQKAAYCGLEWLDTDAFPAEYRGLMVMGNIHAGCLNADRVQRAGATYRASGEADFLVANDAWFMPVAQRIGPDGSLYVLDWYDRYHCYQDARRDPDGIDRDRGRLYRVRYGDTPRAPTFDLAREDDAQLLSRLASGNVFFRRHAQRLLGERASARAELERVALDSAAPRNQRLHALWARIAHGALPDALHRTLLEHPDPTFRAWAVRAAGNARTVSPRVRDALTARTGDASPDVRLQLAIAAPKLAELATPATLLDLAAHREQPAPLPQILWENLRPTLADDTELFVARVTAAKPTDSPLFAELAARALDDLLDREPLRGAAIVALLERQLDGDDPAAAARSLHRLGELTATGELDARARADLRDRLAQRLAAVATTPRSDVEVQMTLLAAAWSEPRGLRLAKEILRRHAFPLLQRSAALHALSAAGDAELVELSTALLADAATPRALELELWSTLARTPDPTLADRLLATYDRLPPHRRAATLGVLVQRAAGRAAVVDAVAAGRVGTSDLDAHQVRALVECGEPATAARARQLWGVLRTATRPDRNAVVDRVRRLLRTRTGDPHAGRAIFTRTCATCHVLHGEGRALGPDLTHNGRGTLEQLLSNVLDPNLVIGRAYQLRTVTTTDGRTLSGIPLERDERRLVLATPSAERVTLPVREIRDERVLPMSLMPEGLEATMDEGELLDLFAYLCLDGPPDDPDARPIAGVVRLEPRETSDVADFADLVDIVAPGFATTASGEDGVALLAEHLGRRWVLRTHPVARDVACSLTRTVTLPAGSDARLDLAVAAHDADRYDWTLWVSIDEETVHESSVGAKTTQDGWLEVSIDLSRFAGETILITVRNAPDGWNYEFGYWGEVRLSVDGRAY